MVFFTALMFAAFIQTKIYSNAIEPSEKTGGRMKISNLFKDFEEDLLRDIFGLLNISAQSKGDVQNPFMILLKKFSKSITVALLTRHQQFVLA